MNSMFDPETEEVAAFLVEVWVDRSSDRSSCILRSIRLRRNQSWALAV